MVTDDLNSIRQSRSVELFQVRGPVHHAGTSQVKLAPNTAS